MTKGFTGLLRLREVVTDSYHQQNEGVAINSKQLEFSKFERCTHHHWGPPKLHVKGLLITMACRKEHK